MKAFLDTTVLTIYCLPPTAKDRHKIRVCLQGYSEVVLFRYAIKEFEAGPLRAFVLAHQALLGNRSLDQVLFWIQRLQGTLQRNLPSTALSAIAIAYRGAAKEMRTSYFRDSKLREIMRLHLKRQILDGWKARLKIGHRIVPDLPCYPETGPVVENRNLRLPQARCHKAQTCALISDIGIDKDEVKRLLVTIRSLPKRSEVERWDRSLSKILNGPIGQRECRGVGDPFFALFVPPDSVIVTTNIRDHGPLTAGLGKTAPQTPF